MFALLFLGSGYGLNAGGTLQMHVSMVRISTIIIVKALMSRDIPLCHLYIMSCNGRCLNWQFTVLCNFPEPLHNRLAYYHDYSYQRGVISIGNWLSSKFMCSSASRYRCPRDNIYHAPVKITRICIQKHTNDLSFECSESIASIPLKLSCHCHQHHLDYLHKNTYNRTVSHSRYCHWKYVFAVHFPNTFNIINSNNLVYCAVSYMPFMKKWE